MTTTMMMMTRPQPLRRRPQPLRRRPRPQRRRPQLLRCLIALAPNLNWRRMVMEGVDLQGLFLEVTVGADNNQLQRHANQWNAQNQNCRHAHVPQVMGMEGADLPRSSKTLRTRRSTSRKVQATAPVELLFRVH